MLENTDINQQEKKKNRNNIKKIKNLPKLETMKRKLGKDEKEVNLKTLTLH